MSVTEIFESRRKFILESYSAGHGFLLFRSNRTAEDANILDVLFTDVRAMELRAWSDGLKIEASNSTTFSDSPTNPTMMIENGLRVYTVKGTGWSGFVVAARLVHKEGTSAPKTPGGLCEL